MPEHPTCDDDAPPATVVVTGADGAVGRAVLAALARDDRVGPVVAVDRTEPHEMPPGVRFVRADLRDAVLARVLADVDVVVNLEFADDRTSEDGGQLAQRVQGTRRLLEAVREAGVPAVVHLSSALVYGASERNRVPLGEDEPLRGEPRFASVDHILAADEAVRVFAADHPACRVVVLRSVPAVAPGMDSAVTRHLESPLLPQVRTFDPPVQFVDVGDLADAVVATAFDPRARGAYNVAADGWLTSSDVRHILARPALHLPQQAAVGAATVLHRLGVLAVPPEALRYLMHPWVVDTARLRALGWTPSASQRDVLHRFVSEHRGWLSAGRVRVRTMRLVLVGVAVWSLVAGAAGLLAWRWWHTRGGT
jgi:nucleoside-diphosphate-sugar epimerase